VRWLPKASVHIVWKKLELELPRRCEPKASRKGIVVNRGGDVAGSGDVRGFMGWESFGRRHGAVVNFGR
jgi:hypothetical protein